MGYFFHPGPNNPFFHELMLCSSSPWVLQNPAELYPCIGPQPELHRCPFRWNSRCVRLLKIGLENDPILSRCPRYDLLVSSFSTPPPPTHTHLHTFVCSAPGTVHMKRSLRSSGPTSVPYHSNQHPGLSQVDHAPMRVCRNGKLVQTVTGYLLPTQLHVSWRLVNTRHSGKDMPDLNQQRDPTHQNFSTAHSTGPACTHIRCIHWKYSSCSCSVLRNISSGFSHLLQKASIPAGCFKGFP